MKLLSKLSNLFCKIFECERDNDAPKNLPKDFYRGLSFKDCLSGKYLTEAAFKFDPFGHNPDRDDNYRELSINWNDSQDALYVLLNQHKPFKEEKQFSVGYALLSVDEVRNVLRTQIANGDFNYERRPVKEDKDNDIAENPYHGNLLIDNNLDKNAIKIIQCTLANIATAGLTLRS